MADERPVLVCAWDSYHRGHVAAHGILVCADCERPMLAIELRGSPAVADDYKPLPMGPASWVTWEQRAPQDDEERGS